MALSFSAWLFLCCAAAAGMAAGSTLDVTLYFRYGETGYLGAEAAQIDLRQEETIATLIVRQLIEGPRADHEQLSGLFPEDTRLISAQNDGVTAFVTLSDDFLGKPQGAPADWEERPAWQEEAALRRRLAFQSIVLSLTEEGRCQRVQLYLAEDDDAIPQRVAMTWFDPEEQDLDLRLAACGRDETVLLTPHLAMQCVLDAWTAKDWAAAWPFIARKTESAPASQSVFLQEMEETEVTLLRYSLSEGTVSLEGSKATIVLDASIRSKAGGNAEIVRESVPLIREDDNWVISASVLKTLLVRD